MERAFLTLLALLTFLALAAVNASAQGWPAKPIRAIVPVGAGSSTDIVHRLVLEQLSSQLGQAVIVKTASAPAAPLVPQRRPRRSRTDTRCSRTARHTIAPALYKNLAYHPARDFAAVAPIGISPAVLVVSPAKGIKSAAELVAAAKARPNALNFLGRHRHGDAPQRGTVPGERGIQAVHIPFKGGAEAMTEVIAGRADFFGPVALVLPHIRDGKLAALAVNTDKRSAALPQVPTTREAGFSDAEYPIWFGLFAPAGTPREIIERLHRETVSALRTPKVQEKLAALGVDPMPMSPAEFATASSAR